MSLKSNRSTASQRSGSKISETILSMAGESGKNIPVSPRNLFHTTTCQPRRMLSLDRPTPRIALSALSLLILLYSLLIAQQILLGVLAIVAVWLVYIFYELVVTLGRIAGALERLVEVREAESQREFGD